ncbi:hypothetical protein [Pedococcus sp. 2YAF34]|uniref:hypothetical protein n=1 Tax=Pedococcus sp. 2YAF34 TaxID=3233032 RepID=UPI003F9620C2
MSPVTTPATESEVGAATRPADRNTPPMVSRTAVGLVLTLALVKGLSTFAEPDVWWHLRTGDRLRQAFDLVAPDPSAGFADRDYTATQWLPEMVASAAYSVGGMGAVLWLRAASVLALAALVFVVARRYSGRLPAAVAAGLTLVGAGGGLNPRPQLVSFVLFAVTLHACLSMLRDGRPRWWLVPVFWVWACCHGLWTFGLALGVLLLAAAVVDPRTRPTRRETLRLAALWLACLAAVALTPLGPRLLLTPFQVAGNASTIADEWRATPLNNVFAWAALVQLLICVVAWSRGCRRPRLWELALLAFAAFCTLWMWRLVPLGSIAATPLVAAALQSGLTARREGWTRTERRGLVAFCAGALVVGALASAGLGGKAAAYPTGMAPIDTALAGLPRHSVVLDDFGVSGWLLWAHPDLTPVADLRGEIYDHAYLADYTSTLRVEPGWQDFVARVHPDVALVARDSALGDALEHRLGWHRVAATHDFLLLAPGDR